MLATFLGLAIAGCSAGQSTVVRFDPSERTESAIAESALLLPVYSNGVPFAYLVKRLQADSILHRAGLRQGDRILAANGQLVSDAFLGGNLVEVLCTESEIALEVESPGQGRRVVGIEFRANE